MPGQGTIRHLRRMKSPFAFRFPPAVPLIVSLCLGFPCLFPAIGRAESDGELKMRLRESEREVERLRDKLHEAQRELGAKAERIEDLETALAETRKRGREPESSRKREVEKRPEASPASQKKKRVPEPPKPSPAVQKKPAAFSVDYEEKSAVNYEGRDKALAWAREQLAADPAARFEVVATADDSEYAEVNRTIAANRAKYLVDFLALSGIPGDRLSSVEGDGSGVGRRATITARIGAGEKPREEAGKKAR